MRGVMVNKINRILFVLIILIVSGCSKVETNTITENTSLMDAPLGDNFVEAGEGLECECLSEICYYVPNDTIDRTFELSLKANELCYDFQRDPLGLGKEIEKTYNKYHEEYGIDWIDFLDWTPAAYNPIISVIVDENITEVQIERIYNGTKLKCLIR